MGELSAADRAISALCFELVREHDARVINDVPLTQQIVDDAEQRAKAAKCENLNASSDMLAILDEAIANLRTAYITQA